MIIQSGGIKGDVKLTQASKFEPTFLNFNLSTARGDLETRIVYSSTVAGYKIHELPIKPSRSVGQNENSCLTTKFIYNPLKTDIGNSPPSGKCSFLYHYLIQLDFHHLSLMRTVYTVDVTMLNFVKYFPTYTYILEFLGNPVYFRIFRSAIPYL